MAPKLKSTISKSVKATTGKSTTSKSVKSTTSKSVKTTISKATTITTTDLKKYIDEVIDDPTMFITYHDLDTIIYVIEYAMDKYYNDQPVMDDETYDFLIDHVKSINPAHPVLKKVGAKVLSKNKVKLPYYMGSMDKIKPSDSNFLTKWFQTNAELISSSTDLIDENLLNQSTFVYSDKLDGVSGLIIFADNKFNLYTRGDGSEGTDITPLIKFIPSINSSKIKMVEGMAVRGELIMSKINFAKYADKMANARNMVAGIVNSKSVDPGITADVDFVAYEVINPWITNQQNQWSLLEKAGFKVVHHGVAELDNESTDESFAHLSDILMERKSQSAYEIDGIIVSTNVLESERTPDTNPTYAFAFKDTSQMAKAEVEVISVDWAISKDGYIKPKLSIQPTKLAGVTISNVTAFNAKFVKDNVLGPGAVIELIRSGDVIPHITKVIKPANDKKPQMPLISYTWNATGVDIITTEETTDQKIKELTFFLKKLNIADIDESSVRKMVDADIDSIPLLISISASDLEGIEGFKDRKITKTVTNIQTRMSTLTMFDLMVASNCFGHGLGERKLKKIVEVYPDIIALYSENDEDDIVEMVKQIDGFDVKTAEYFAQGLDSFIDLFNELTPNMRKQLRISIQTMKEAQEQNKELIAESTKTGTNNIVGKTFVFSGFRNKEWEKIIESKGGKVSSSVSKNTYAVVTTKADIREGTNSKIVKAQSFNVRVISKEDFEEEFIKNS
jgi:DNA ligase (NAD+)